MKTEQTILGDPSPDTPSLPPCFIVIMQLENCGLGDQPPSTCSKLYPREGAGEGSVYFNIIKYDKILGRVWEGHFLFHKSDLFIFVIN